jgi:predicted phage terminase large subunit-like protein
LTVKKKGLLKDITLEALEAGRAAFKGDTEAKKQKRMADCEMDLLRFGRTYCPHYFSYSASEFHEEIAELTDMEQFLNLVAPRGFAKSTILSFLKVLHWIVYERKHFILLISDTMPQATLFLQAIKEELESNEKLIGDFGHLEGEKKWSEKDFITSTGIRVVARGTGNKLRGLRHRQYRPDAVVLDDPQNDEHVESHQQREKDWRWFIRVVLNVGQEDTCIFVIGTIIHPECIVFRLIDNEGFTSRVYRAIKDDGTSLWPERWPIEKLELKRKQLGSVAFDMEFMNRCHDPETHPFDTEKFTYFDLSEIALEEMEVTVGAWDPAMGQEAGKARRGSVDYAAIATVGRDESGYLYVLDCWMSKVPPLKQIEAAFRLYATWGWRWFGIETVAFQKVLKTLIDQLSRKLGIYLPTRAIEQHKNKVTRILGLQPLCENGTLRFRKDQTLLLQQFADFPTGDHDDGPDAVEQAVSLLVRKRKPGLWVLPGLDEEALDN